MPEDPKVLGWALVPAIVFVGSLFELTFEEGQVQKDEARWGLGLAQGPSLSGGQSGRCPREVKAVVECTDLLGGDMLFSKVLKLHAGHEWG